MIYDSVFADLLEKMDVSSKSEASLTKEELLEEVQEFRTMMREVRAQSASPSLEMVLLLAVQEATSFAQDVLRRSEKVKESAPLAGSPWETARTCSPRLSLKIFGISVT